MTHDGAPIDGLQEVAAQYRLARRSPWFEATDSIELVEVDEVGRRSFRPTPWSLIELVGNCAYGNLYRDTLEIKDGQLSFSSNVHQSWGELNVLRRVELQPDS
jgi:hypothetical protein